MTTESIALQPVEVSHIEAELPETEVFGKYAAVALRALDDTRINPDPIMVEYGRDETGKMQHIGERSIAQDTSVRQLFEKPRDYIFEQLDKIHALQNPSNPRHGTEGLQRALWDMKSILGVDKYGSQPNATMEQVIMGAVDAANKNPNVAERYRELVAFGIRLGRAMFTEAKTEDFHRSSPSTTPADRGFNDREVRALSRVLAHSQETGELAMRGEATVHTLGRSVVSQMIDAPKAA